MSHLTNDTAHTQPPTSVKTLLENLHGETMAGSLYALCWSFEVFVKRSFYKNIGVKCTMEISNKKHNNIYLYITYMNLYTQSTFSVYSLFFKMRLYIPIYLNKVIRKSYLATLKNIYMHKVISIWYSGIGVFIPAILIWIECEKDLYAILVRKMPYLMSTTVILLIIFDYLSQFNFFVYLLEKYGYFLSFKYHKWFHNVFPFIIQYSFSHILMQLRTFPIHFHIKIHQTNCGENNVSLRDYWSR